MADDLNDFNRKVIDEFRANDGRVGGNFEGARSPWSMCRVGTAPPVAR